MSAKKYLIVTGTVTYAIKGRDILRKHGIKANVERILSDGANTGCGYSVAVYSSPNKAVELLKLGGVKILEVREKLNNNS